MGALLAIDPGLHACGAAVFDANGQLRRAELANHTDKSSMNWPKERARVITATIGALRVMFSGVQIDELAIELPQSYGDRESQKGDQNDLLHLSAVVGAVCLEFENATTTVYLPREWKGQVPKKIHHQRAMKRLSSEELAQIPKLAASKLHNVLDAVALGLHHLKRL